MAKSPTLTVCRLSDEVVLLAFEGYTMKAAEEISKNIINAVKDTGSTLKVGVFFGGKVEMIKSGDFEAGVRAIYQKIKNETI